MGDRIRIRIEFVCSSDVDIMSAIGSSIAVNAAAAAVLRSQLPDAFWAAGHVVDIESGAKYAIANLTKTRKDASSHGATISLPPKPRKKASRG